MDRTETTRRTLPDGSPAGFGDADRYLAECLAHARTPDEADQIARDDGHKDAEDARRYLEGRS